jgi:transposase-like protein
MLTPWERVMVFLTGKRKYCCMDCNKRFRALDRRKTSREDAALEAARAAADQRRL